MYYMPQPAETLATREGLLQAANRSLERARGEAEILQGELEQARAREREAVEAVAEERRAARDKMAGLEGVIEKSEREHDLLRVRLEGRLERLRLAMEEEEQEDDSQVCWIPVCSRTVVRCVFLWDGRGFFNSAR